MESALVNYASVPVPRTLRRDCRAWRVGGCGICEDVAWRKVHQIWGHTVGDVGVGSGMAGGDAGRKEAGQAPQCIQECMDFGFYAVGIKQPWQDFTQGVASLDFPGGWTRHGGRGILQPEPHS